MNIAVPALLYLRNQGIDIISSHEQGWGEFDDTQILSEAHVRRRFVLTHDSDFGTLALHRGEPFTGIIYLRPGGRPPQQVISDLQDVINADIDWTPPVIAVYCAGRLRLRRP
jgi:predicted nuclease of predicted toxin-antitoxin system